MNVRKLTDKGTDLFRDYLGRIRTGAKEAAPRSLLTDRESSSPMPGNAEVEDRDLRTRADAAEYLVKALAKIPQDQVDHNPALWNWLTLFFFDQICPTRADGTRKVAEEARYLLPPITDARHFQRYYRHVLAGSYRIRRQHGSSGKVFLCGDISVFDDFNEQLASRMELISNRAVVEAADVLYFDPARQKAKRGAGTKDRAGTLRRFVTVLQQFDLTYDLYSMNGKELLELLPGEFEKWRGPNA